MENRNNSILDNVPVQKNPTVGFIFKLCVEKPGGYKEMSSIFADQ